MSASKSQGGSTGDHSTAQHSGSSSMGGSGGAGLSGQSGGLGGSAGQGFGGSSDTGSRKFHISFKIYFNHFVLR